MKKIILFLLIVSCLHAWAQTSGDARLQSYSNLKKSSFNGIAFRNIGPTVMSGRITDIDVNPNNTTEFYVAYASGGVWYSNNNGQSMVPVFDHEASMTIGDIAVNWKKNIIWVGTGEVNSSRSSYAGTGVYVSTDSGKTWMHRGLEESHHIGKVILDPNNSNIAWVAVLGHLYSKNPERGIYKTTDGGLHWKHTLQINDSTGCVDMVMDPSNPEVMYASSWTRLRRAWNFTGCGEGSAIYKSVDGGESWKRMTDENSGFPIGKGVGRIGLALFQGKEGVLYAVLDNNFNQSDFSEEEKKKLKPREIDTMTTEAFLAMDNKKLKAYLEDNGYPGRYTAESLKQDIKDHKYTVHDVAEWKLADADASLFDTPVFGAELYRSEDGGVHWEKTHDKPLNGIFFTYGYYFATVSVSPLNDQKVFIGGYPIVCSEDGGKTFKEIGGDNCHPDYHRIWIDPHNDQHIMACNDGGLNITYDGGKIWFKANNPAVGQFYGIAIDDEKPYNVYGGLQDNGTWYGSSRTEENTAWHQSGHYDYKSIGGGDGMQVQVDSRNSDVYVGYQFGNYARVNKENGNATDVKPEYYIGETPLRFNWQTPILLSQHNEDIFYLGSNYFHRSLHKGENPEKLGEELTITKRKGNVPFGTITTISESPKRFGLLYAGTDDGLIHVSHDVGYTWTNITAGLPQDKWVTRVVASKYKMERVYATLNDYRKDDFNAYVFVSNDYGKTWKDISGSLPKEPVNVLREDPLKENMLYVGTDNGLYVSHDSGEHFQYWQSNLPRVAIHDIAIQERENEIVLGTHGRSIYIASLNEIQQYDSLKNSSLALLPIDSIRYNKRIGQKNSAYGKPVENTCTMHYFTSSEDSLVITVINEKGRELYRETIQPQLGFNSFEYHLNIQDEAVRYFKSKLNKSDDGHYYLPSGKYRIIVEQGEHEAEGGLCIWTKE